MDGRDGDTSYSKCINVFFDGIAGLYIDLLSAAVEAAELINKVLHE